MDSNPSKSGRGRSTFERVRGVILVQQICIEFETQQLNLLPTHTLMRVQAKDYIREIQTRLIVPPVMKRLRLALAVWQDLNR